MDEHEYVSVGAHGGDKRYDGYHSKPHADGHYEGEHDALFECLRHCAIANQVSVVRTHEASLVVHSSFVVRGFNVVLHRHQR